MKPDDELKQISEGDTVVPVSTVRFEDVDGDCIPDYLTINIRWVLGMLASLLGSVIGYVMLLVH